MKLTLSFDSVEEMESFCKEHAERNAVCAGSAVQETVNVTTPVQPPVLSVGQAPLSQQALQTPVQSVVPAVQQPIQQMSVPQQMMSTPVPNIVPTTAVAQEFSYDQLAVAAAGLMNAGKGQQLHAILQQFGVQAMTELPKERYGEFATAIRAEGAVI